jgi:hypothetical protein
MFAAAEITGSDTPGNTPKRTNQGTKARAEALPPGGRGPVAGDPG